MLVGIDFDNTIVAYGDLFYRAAVERELVPLDAPQTKGAVRDYLRIVGREDDWTELQGYLYGVAIEQAEPFPGVIDFAKRCRSANVPTKIISHRTRRPYRGEQYDLHEAARCWLTNHGLTDMVDGVFLEETREAKLNRITESKCTYFIDDLPEFLADPAFPATVQRILFDPDGQHADSADYVRTRSWQEISQLLL